MAVTLRFKNKSFVYTQPRYKREINNLLETILKGIDCEVYPYFSKTSESVYIALNPREIEGYILFIIKGHKMVSPNSIRSFNTLKYENRKGLATAVRNYIQGCIDGKNSVFKFKYGNFIGLNSLKALGKKGYKVACSQSEFYNNSLKSIELTRGSVSLKVDDETFINRVSRLVNNGLVRCYDLEGDRGLLYVTDLGFKLYNLEKENFLIQYNSDVKINSLEGLIERNLK